MANGIRFFELNTGAKIPSVGLGTWQATPELVGNAVATAIKAGYRHIDCAQVYDNEKEIGTVLKKLFEDGVVKRGDLWITSKLWCTDYSPEDVPEALNRTLKDLQLDYVDLYLIHCPVRMKKGSVGYRPENLIQLDIPCTWRAMEELYDSGKARAIGVSNFSTKKLGDLLEGYTPLGAPGKALIESDVLKHPVLNIIEEKLDRTPAQVALRWGLQMGHSVLPKSTNEARIKENFDVYDWSIPQDLFSKFSKIEQVRLMKGNAFVHEALGPYRSLEELWDGDV